MPQFDMSKLRPLLRAVLKIAAVIALVVAANHLLNHVQSRLDLEIRPANEDMIYRMTMVFAVLYALALAVPFVPGVEIGLGLMAVLGLKIVPLVYVSTIAGLCLAFLAGRSIPLLVLVRLARDAHLSRTHELLVRFERLPESQKLSFLVRIAPGLSKVLLRHRYVALLLLINLPGNILIGGGGGIALLAGASRIFTWPRFILTVAIAVSPVPLTLILLGPQILAQ